jgi:hypothetical protein
LFCFLGRFPISQVVPLNSPWGCQTYAHRMMLGKTAAYQAQQTQMFVFHTNWQTRQFWPPDPNLWAPLHLGTDSAPSDGTHTNCFHGPPTTAKFAKFYSQTSEHGENNINPPCAVQGGLSKKAQRYIGYNGLCLAAIGMLPSAVRAYE